MCISNDGGSLAVNNAGWRSFLDHDAVRQAGGVAEFCQRRNISHEECQRQLSNEIECIKTQYDPDGALTYPVSINETPTLDKPSVGPTYIVFERSVIHCCWFAISSLTQEVARYENGTMSGYD